MTTSVFLSFLIRQHFYFKIFFSYLSSTLFCMLRQKNASPCVIKNLNFSVCCVEPLVLCEKKGRWYKFNSLCFINFYLIFNIIYGQPLNIRLPSNSLPDLFPRLQDFALSDNICIWQHSTYICKSWEIDANHSSLNNYIVGINNRHV